MYKDRIFIGETYKVLAKNFFHQLTKFVSETFHNPARPASASIVLDVFGKEVKSGYVLALTNKQTRKLAKFAKLHNFIQIRDRREILSVKNLYALMFAVMFTDRSHTTFDISQDDLVMIYTIESRADGTKDLKYTVGIYVDDFQTAQDMADEGDYSFVYCFGRYCEPKKPNFPQPEELMKLTIQQIFSGSPTPFGIRTFSADEIRREFLPKIEAGEMRTYAGSQTNFNKVSCYCGDGNAQETDNYLGELVDELLEKSERKEPYLIDRMKAYGKSLFDYNQK